ncbi:MAG: TonB family protein [Pseudomonadota bacterium]
MAKPENDPVLETEPADAGKEPVAADLSVGQKLAQARTEQGLTREAVSEDTRIKLDYVTALETGDYGALPALSFAAGFVKIYARRVGLPADELARAYRAEVESPAGSLLQANVAVHPAAGDKLDHGPAPLRPAKAAEKVPVLALLALAAICAFAAWAFFALASSRQPVLSKTKEAPAVKEELAPTEAPAMIPAQTPIQTTEPIIAPAPILATNPLPPSGQGTMTTPKPEAQEPMPEAQEPMPATSALLVPSEQKRQQTDEIANAAIDITQADVPPTEVTKAETLPSAPPAIDPIKMPAPADVTPVDVAPVDPAPVSSATPAPAPRLPTVIRGAGRSGVVNTDARQVILGANTSLQPEKRTILPTPPDVRQGPALESDDPITDEQSYNERAAENLPETPISSPDLSFPPIDPSSTAASDEIIISRAKLVRSVPPKFPSRCASRARPIEKVGVSFTVSSLGTVQSPTVTNSTNPCFNRAALKSVQRWRFNPRLENGRPIESPQRTATVRFRR